MFKFLIVTPILIIILFSGILLSAAEYYIPPTGDDNASENLNSPWKTFKHATNSIRAGDTVYLRAGIYEEKLEINNSDSATNGYITLKNNEGEFAVLDATNSNQDTNSTFAATLFNTTDSTPPDFSLQTNSPAINAGNHNFTTKTGETDFDENPKINDYRIDCGAYEYIETETNYTLTISIIPNGAGTVTIQGSYTAGKTVTLTATPNKDYVFSGWSEDLTGSNTPATLLMNANKTITATFLPAASKDLHITLGSVITITVDDISSPLNQFIKKPIVYATYGNNNSARFKLTSATPATQINVLWKKKLKLYDRKNYKNVN